MIMKRHAVFFLALLLCVPFNTGIRHPPEGNGTQDNLVVTSEKSDSQTSVGIERFHRREDDSTVALVTVPTNTAEDDILFSDHIVSDPGHTVLESVYTQPYHVVTGSRGSTIKRWITTGDNQTTLPSDAAHLSYSEISPLSTVSARLSANTTAAPCPNPTHIRCGNGKCVWHGWQCDGWDQCGDNSDEDGCPPRHCDVGQYQCPNGKCLRYGWRCNGYRDCSDSADEKGCLRGKNCRVNQFLCDNGNCMWSYRRCNGRDDCGDNSDEHDCPPRNCASNQFRCDKIACLPLKFRCDKRADCVDKTDEFGCPLFCGYDKFPCRSGNCEHPAKLCNKVDNCGDKSDEVGCSLSNCSAGQFQCSNGRCILSELRCDGRQNCHDNSDEEGCMTFSKGQVNCPTNVRIREKTVGRFEVKGAEFYSYCKWLMTTSKTLGVVVRFEEVDLQLGDNPNTDDIIVRPGLRSIANFGNSHVDPVVVSVDTVSFEFVSYGRLSPNDSRVNATDWKPSSLKVFYTTYPKNTLPPALDMGVYNCSPPYIVPEELQCDGIAQCLDGEDELDYNCSYTHLGCDEGWVAGERLCLKFVFPTVRVTPDRAKSECRERYNADLGSLPHLGVRRRAARLMLRTNHSEVIVGLERIEAGHLYRFLWRWTQAGTEFDGPQPHQADNSLNCAILTRENLFKSVDCLQSIKAGYVCAKLNDQRKQVRERERLNLDPPANSNFRIPVKQCGLQYVVQTFHPCTQHVETESFSPAQLPLLSCKNGRHVHYTLTCDGYDDCGDGTDEIECEDTGGGLLSRASFICQRQTEAVDSSYRCNGIPDCHDGSDEENCATCARDMPPCGGAGCMPCGTKVCSLAPNTNTPKNTNFDPSLWTREIDMDAFGVVRLYIRNAINACRDSYFLCGRTTAKYCIPTFLVGNGQRDCPEVVGSNSSDDEPAELTCPGHYRCYKHNICVHPNYICDGVYQCPLKDDERYCDLPCPQHCLCEGRAYTCTRMFAPSDNLHVRYLDLNGISQPKLDSLHQMTYLQFLNISSCGLNNIPTQTLRRLKVLDVSFNKLRRLTVDVGMDVKMPNVEILKASSCSLTAVALENVHHLRELDLSLNELQSLRLQEKSLERLNVSSCRLNVMSLVHLDNLKILDASRNNNLTSVTLERDNVTLLESLNLSSCGLTSVTVAGLMQLRELDLSNNNLTALNQVELSGLLKLTHLDLSDNPLLTGLDEEFRNFLVTSGLNSLLSLFLSNTGIVGITADPFAGLITHPHLSGTGIHPRLDVTGNDITEVERNIFMNWTQIGVFETSNVSICCAYFTAVKEHKTDCRTAMEIVFPEQCSTKPSHANVDTVTTNDFPGKSPDCDVGWLWYGSLCLRFVFPIDNISASIADNDCRRKFHAGFAALPTQALKDLSGRFLKLSRHKELIVGLQKVHLVTEGLRHLYRFLWRWTQAGTAFDWSAFTADLNCATFRPSASGNGLRAIDCHEKGEYAYVCSKTHTAQVRSASHTSFTLPLPSSEYETSSPFRPCGDGTFVLSFHVCRFTGEPAKSAVKSYAFLYCRNGRRVHYTLTCDGFDDCGDSSDEEQCQSGHSQLLIMSYFLCKLHTEVVDRSYRCNGVPDCRDGSDEENCDGCSHGLVLCAGSGCLPAHVCKQLSNQNTQNSHELRSQSFDSGHTKLLENKILQQVDFNTYGYPSLSTAKACPETHFECQGGFCIPTFLINNGQPDCHFETTEDETPGVVQCPGHYRCYQHQICLHPEYVCDGVYHCPLKDDERYCNLSCPVNCTCEGFAYSCSRMFHPADHLHVRYLDVSGSFQPPLETLHYMGFLHFLNLSLCSLSSVSLDSLVLLRVLDLSFNNFTSLSSIVLGVKPLLTHLNISSNPLLGQLDAIFREFLVKSNTVFLQSVELRRTEIKHIQDNVFMNMSSIVHLDLRENEIQSVSKYIFSGLSGLKILETDDPRLCCPYFFLYGDETTDCRTPIDELSSCNDLLRSDFFRGFLWTLSAMAISGNIGVLVYRVFLETHGSSSGFRVLVANLCVADFLMGVYLVFIGAADAHYSGQYIWIREAWTRSKLCQIAGFVALLSSEVSAFFICVITTDRLLVLRFPLHRHLHLTTRSATMTCGAVWVVGFFLASVPLLPAEWTFYGQTGICLPLPITRKPFLGQHYAFGVFVILNFLLFVLIGVGQLLIYHAVRKTSMASRTTRRKQDVAIARRLSLIVSTDFCCWFPIGLMGLLALNDTPIPGEVNVWAAIFILPVNSAINPFLYTLSMLVERWLKRREERHVERTLAKLHADMVTWSDTKVQELLTHCQKLLKRLRANKRVDTRQRCLAPLDARPQEATPTAEPRLHIDD